MSWLAIHIWVELLIAAAFGGLIGWALHARRSGAAIAEAPAQAARVAELQTQLHQEREETASLRTRLASPGDAPNPGAPPEASLSWRNRYLESRVRYLEGRLGDFENGLDPAPAPIAAVKQDEPDDATRLRWRNRYLEGRIRYLEDELVGAGALAPSGPETDTDSASARIAARSAPPDSDKPAPLAAPRSGGADDLKEITGIGPKLERVLNGLGVWHFDQIAAWTQKEIDWVNAAINFRNRIERETWVEQARLLAQGVETEGKRAYLEGKQV